MHIRYLLEKVSKPLFDKKVEEELNKEKSSADQLAGIIKSYEGKIAELEEEKQKILKITMDFGIFLKFNCISPVNDAFPEYVESEINIAKTSDNPDEEKIKSLKASLDKFYENKKEL